MRVAGFVTFKKAMSIETNRADESTDKHNQAGGSGSGSGE